MNLSTDRTGGIVIVRVDEAKLVHPLLPTFAESVSDLLSGGDRRVIIDMSHVVYLDSACIGCLMDLYRQADKAGGALKLAGVQARVETMLTMTGANRFIELHPDEPSAVHSFGE
jgi:anti-sigma B factor antagonist